MPPFEANPDRDVFLVSYPRSGSTWLRAVIANLQLHENIRSLRELDFIVPDIHYQVALRRVRRLPFYVVKSHYPLGQGLISQKFKRIIYVIRDPRDVALSYYRFASKLKQYTGGLPKFILDMAAGRIWPCSWQEHVGSWTKWPSGQKERDILLLRYEDICQKPEVNIGLIDRFLRLNSDQALIHEIALSTSAEGMRNKELAGNRPSIERAESYFVGKASPGEWLKTMDAESAKLIKRFAAAIMSEHGYE